MVYELEGTLSTVIVSHMDHMSPPTRPYWATSEGPPTHSENSPQIQAAA